MIEPYLLPVYALFIGACSAFIGTFYMNALPAFPLTRWWWQWGQRFEFSKKNPYQQTAIFKAIWFCPNCFSGHVGWISALYFAFRYFTLTWKDIPTVAFCVLLAAGVGHLFSTLFNDYLTDLKKRNGTV